ncbi:MAG TPA: type III pantothenate kinase [Thermomonas sp.]|nr:type III pantothenate kinase [Thermomonas sp.]
MSTWLFDLGNTRLKGAPLLADGSIGETLAIAHDDGADWLDRLPSGTVACIASVAADARRAALFDALCTRFTRLHRVRTERALGPLRIAYETPAHLGVDRFLAMLGECGEGPALVVGVGTALTIDLLDADGRHHGGRIAPSPRLMREALHARAVQLPVDGGRYAEFADDTGHALASGCEGAALALIERSLQEAQATLGMLPSLCLHGGGADALRDRLPTHRWRPDAVLHGLARWQALRIA